MNWWIPKKMQKSWGNHIGQLSSKRRMTTRLDYCTVHICTSSPKSIPQNGMFQLWVSGSFVTYLLWDFSFQMYLPMHPRSFCRMLDTWRLGHGENLTPFSLANSTSVILRWPIWDGCACIDLRQVPVCARYIKTTHSSNRLQKKWLSASSWSSPECLAMTLGMAPQLESRPDCEGNYFDVDGRRSSEHAQAGSHAAAWILELLLSPGSPRLA